MKEFSKRLQEVITHYNINAGAFAKKISVQKSSLSHLLSGRNKPSFLFINKMSDVFPEINITWFVTGKGQMLIKQEQVNIASSEDKANKENEKTYKNPNEISTSLDIDERQALESLYKGRAAKQILIIYNDDTFKILNQATK